MLLTASNKHTEFALCTAESCNGGRSSEASHDCSYLITCHNNNNYSNNYSNNNETLNFLYEAHPEKLKCSTTFIKPEYLPWNEVKNSLQSYRIS